MFAAHKSAFQAAGFEATYIGTNSSSANTDVYNFGDFTTSKSGIIVAMFTSNGGNSRIVNSISIGGDASNLIASATSAAQIACAGYAVKSAGTHNITATLNGLRGTSSSNLVAVWLLSGYSSGTPISSDLQTASSTNSRTITLDHQSGGIALYSIITNSSDTTRNWTSATTELLQVVNGRPHCHAFIFPTATATGHTETVSGFPSTGNAAFGISFR
jgi:hypothetical protein